MTMSSSCKVLVPFEDDPRTDHKKLRTALYDIELEDTANVTEAMKAACSLLREKFSVSAVGCQVVIVVDGAPSFAELRQLRDIVNHLPKYIVFHIIAMGSDDELHRCSIYQTLAERWSRFPYIPLAHMPSQGLGDSLSAFVSPRHVILSFSLLDLPS